MPILNYQLQRYKLIPQLAKAYAMIATFRLVQKMISEINVQVTQNNFSNLQEAHILLSGAKSFFSWWASRAVEVAMQCCGGHGYSSYSGLPKLYYNSVPNTILEGENTVLSLQVSKYLMKCYRRMKMGQFQKIKGHCNFFLRFEELQKFEVVNSDSFLKDGQNAIKLFQKTVLRMVESIAQKSLELSSDMDMDMTEIVNKKMGIQLFELSKIHTVMFTAQFFFRLIETKATKGNRQVFDDLFWVFVIDQILENAQIFTSFGIICGKFVSFIREKFEALMDSLHYDSLVLSEGYVHSDFTLFSAIANLNEKPYENLFSWAKKFGALNQVDLRPYYLNTIRKASIETYGRPKL